MFVLVVSSSPGNPVGPQISSTQRMNCEAVDHAHDHHPVRYLVLDYTRLCARPIIKPWFYFAM